MQEAKACSRCEGTIYQSNVKPNVKNWFDKLCLVAKAAAKKLLPTRKENVMTQRMVFQRTKNLIRQKRRLRKDKKTLEKVKAEIKSSCLEDFKTWVSDTVTDIESANEVGDTRRIFKQSGQHTIQ